MASSSQGGWRLLWQDFVFFATIVRVIGFDAAQPGGHDIFTFSLLKKAILVNAFFGEMFQSWSRGAPRGSGAAEQVELSAYLLTTRHGRLTMPNAKKELDRPRTPPCSKRPENPPPLRSKKRYRALGAAIVFFDIQVAYAPLSATKTKY